MNASRVLEILGRGPWAQEVLADFDRKTKPIQKLRGGEGQVLSGVLSALGKSLVEQYQRHKMPRAAAQVAKALEDSNPALMILAATDNPFASVMPEKAREHAVRALLLAAAGKDAEAAVEAAHAVTIVARSYFGEERGSRMLELAEGLLQELAEQPSATPAALAEETPAARRVVEVGKKR